jgi:hypothetical protein
MSDKRKDGGEHWLDRPRNIKILIWLSLAVLAATVLADFFYEGHPHFGVDGWFGFYAWYGFLTCVVMVLAAKLLGFVLKRPDDYYDDE